MALNQIVIRRLMESGFFENDLFKPQDQQEFANSPTVGDLPGMFAQILPALVAGHVKGAGEQLREDPVGSLTEGIDFGLSMSPVQDVEDFGTLADKLLRGEEAGIGDLLLLAPFLGDFIRKKRLGDLEFFRVEDLRADVKASNIDIANVNPDAPGSLTQRQIFEHQRDVSADKLADIDDEIAEGLTLGRLLSKPGRAIADQTIMVAEHNAKKDRLRRIGPADEARDFLDEDLTANLESDIKFMEEGPVTASADTELELGRASEDRDARAAFDRQISDARDVRLQQQVIDMSKARADTFLPSFGLDVTEIPIKDLNSMQRFDLINSGWIIDLMSGVMRRRPPVK